MSKMSTQWVDWTKTTQSKDYRGSGSFASYLIIGPVCFFLGVLFASFPYDFPLLWTSAPVEPAYLDQLETHLKFIHQSPPLIARLLSMIISVGFLGFFVKLFRPSEANMLFDGASLVLYLIGVGIYVANIVHGLRTVSADIWDDPAMQQKVDGPLTGEILLGREDSLKVLSASNTILALVLVGILILQAGQWYAERHEADEMQQQAKAQSSNKQQPSVAQHADQATSTATKKKQ